MAELQGSSQFHIFTAIFTAMQAGSTDGYHEQWGEFKAGTCRISLIFSSQSDTGFAIDAHALPVTLHRRVCLPPLMSSDI